MGFSLFFKCKFYFGMAKNLSVSNSPLKRQMISCTNLQYSTTSHSSNDCSHICSWQPIKCAAIKRRKELRGKKYCQMKCWELRSAVSKEEKELRSLKKNLLTYEKKIQNNPFVLGRYIYIKLLKSCWKESRTVPNNHHQKT